MRRDLNQMTPQLAEIIKTGRAGGLSWQEVANNVNEAGLRNVSGGLWNGGNLAGFSIRKHVTARVQDTVYGPAGSSGYGKRKERKKKKRAKYKDNGNGQGPLVVAEATFSPSRALAQHMNGNNGNGHVPPTQNALQEIEEIMTSNMPATLKVKCIAAVTSKVGA